jgi:hypothetical protein
MPILPELDAEGRIWTLTTGPSFDLTEIAEVTRATDWQGAKRFLWDLRNLDKGPASTQEIQEAAELTEANLDIWRGTRIAVLVNRDLDFGVARMFGAFAERFDLEFGIYRDKDSAIEWLRS